MIKKKIKKKDNIINFPKKLSSIEKEIEAIVFAAAEPLDINTIENSNIYYIPQSNILLSNNNLIINTSNIITPNNEFGIKIHINIDHSNYTFEDYLYFNIKY